MPQAALFALVSASETLSSSIEGTEGADGPADEPAAARIAGILLQLLPQLSAVGQGTSMGQGSSRIQQLELQLMEGLAPALMHHLAITGGQAQVSLLF